MAESSEERLQAEAQYEYGKAVAAMRKAQRLGAAQGGITSIAGPMVEAMGFGLIGFLAFLVIFR